MTAPRFASRRGRYSTRRARRARGKHALRLSSWASVFLLCPLSLGWPASPVSGLLACAGSLVSPSGSPVSLKSWETGSSILPRQERFDALVSVKNGDFKKFVKNPESGTTSPHYQCHLGFHSPQGSEPLATGPARGYGVAPLVTQFCKGWDGGVYQRMSRPHVAAQSVNVSACSVG